MNQLQVLLEKIINRIMKLLTRLDHLIEEEGITYMARTDNIDPDDVLTPLQAARRAGYPGLDPGVTRRPVCMGKRGGGLQRKTHL